MTNMTDTQLLTAYGQHGNIAWLRNVASMAVQQHLVDANKMIEPFGYFRPTIDGWEDCAEHDEGARPLYERPPK
jgi:hypothetical protein